jgi:2,5-dihydroxypyridine 5,6-dioxygenase
MPYARTFDGPAAAADLTGLFHHQLALSRVKPGESVVCVTDTAWNPVYGAACLAAALALGAEASLITLPASRPPPAAMLGAALAAADLIVYATHFTLHYRPEMRAALDRGARALCVMQPIHVLDRLKGDPAVRRRARAGAALLGGARQIRIASDAGTDLLMDKTGRPGLAAYGYADTAGHLDFWGGGMAQAAQIEGTTRGRLVLDTGDAIFHLGRMVESPVAITFVDGRITAIEGGLDAKLIRLHLEDARDPNAFLAGHMAFGVDHRAKWLAPVVDTPDAGGGGADSEGFLGNVQIEIGSNDDVLFGGRNRTSVHLGLCCLATSLWLDGRPVVEAGRLVAPELDDRPPSHRELAL